MGVTLARPDPFASNEEWLAAGREVPGPGSDYRVARVEVVNACTLYVTHCDGVRGHVRFEASAFCGIFKSLSDPAVFRQAHVDHGAVIWSDELDLAPDNMHRHLFAFGEWVLQ